MHSKYDSSLIIISEYKKQLFDLIDSKWPNCIKDFLKFIIENLYDESLNIRDANQVCRITRKNFSSKFKIYVGTTPKKFILEHRINAGKKLLLKRNLTIAEVSILVGFSSHSAFSKAFIRDSSGISPSIWLGKIHEKNHVKPQAS